MARFNNNQKLRHDPKLDFQQYFKIGVSQDFILIRDDFPLTEITPGEFSRLCLEMFGKNDEVLHGK